ncbi:hypothetical protein BH09MYX1_BH09MYX1_40930 [soil metagenome]
MYRRLALLVPAAIGIALAAAACANDGYGTDACREIEAERCRWVVQCEIPVGVRRSNSTSPVDDCVRYYRDACYHGLTNATQDPTDVQTAACVNAIHNATTCDIVYHPETDPACAWLKPSTDAGVDADAATVATDAASADATGQ